MHFFITNLIKLFASFYKAILKELLQLLNIKNLEALQIKTVKTIKLKKMKELNKKKIMIIIEKDFTICKWTHNK